MKKKNNIFVKLFRPLGKLIDKLLIRPVTKLILKLREWANSVASIFDKMSNNKSFLLFVSLILAFGSFIIIDRERDVAMDQYAEISLPHLSFREFFYYTPQNTEHAFLDVKFLYCRYPHKRSHLYIP